MNEKKELGLGSDPAVKESLTAASKHHVAITGFVGCRTACNHIDARILMEDELYLDSTMQKMHSAKGCKLAKHENLGLGISSAWRRKPRHTGVATATSYEESELERIPTVKESLTVQTEGTRND